MLNRARLWLRSVILRRRLEREMRGEMATHLDEATARLMARGLAESDARREAQREFGHLTSLQEEARMARGTGWIDALVADVRFAVRQYARNRGTALTILVVLAVGMSISTTLFSVLHSYSVQAPPGMTAADDLVRIRGSERFVGDAGTRRFTLDELREYERLTDHFSAVAAWANDPVSLEVAGGEGRALPASATFVTPNYFDVIGVRPILGAGLPGTASDDARSQQVAVIGHSMWERLFARSPSVIGTTVSINGIPVTIVGVAPPRFMGVNSFSDMKLWLPVASRSRFVAPARPDAEVYAAAARLRPGVRMEAATAATRVIGARAAAALEPAAGGRPQRIFDTDVVQLLSSSGDPNFERDGRILTAALATLGLLVLLVTCANVSALLAGLAVARRREIAVRLSLGAARIRIIRQLLTESTLLATIAGVAALGALWAIHRAANAFIPALPMEIGVSVPAALFTFGVAIAVGVAFGISPALHATRLTVASALRDATSMIAASRARLQRTLVVAQIAFTQPLIVAVAAILLLVLGEYQRHGVNDAGASIVSMRLRAAAPAATTQDDSSARRERVAAIRQLRDRLLATPGVIAAVHDLRSTVTLDFYSAHSDDRSAAGAAATFRLSAQMVAPGYFDVMGIPLVLGGGFAATDSSMPMSRNPTPVVIGADLARHLWPDASPIGRRLRISESAPDGVSPDFAAGFTVVGVADQTFGEFSPVSDGYRVYIPPGTGQTGALAMLVRTTGGAESMIPTLRAVVRDHAPGLVATDIRTIAEIEAEIRNGFFLAIAILAGGGALALLLAAIGLYAVVAFAVQQRTGEIAVRMAVGAQTGNIVRTFTGEGLRLGAIGLGIGLPMSLGAVHLILSVDPALPKVALGPAGLVAGGCVLLVAAAAAWIPARRAAGVDPATILRRD